LYFAIVQFRKFVALDSLRKYLLAFQKLRIDRAHGIALCPNLHRAFDRGLIGIDNDYRVLVSKSFREDETNYSIRIFENRQIILPKQEIFYPLKENFNRHKNKLFKL
jgi:predicted restriction endonuclease